jgi:hypothetical protein
LNLHDDRRLVAADLFTNARKVRMKQLVAPTSSDDQLSAYVGKAEYKRSVQDEKNCNHSSLLNSPSDN